MSFVFCLLVLFFISKKKEPLSLSCNWRNEASLGGGGLPAGRTCAGSSEWKWWSVLVTSSLAPPRGLMEDTHSAGGLSSGPTEPPLGRGQLLHSLGGCSARRGTSSLLVQCLCSVGGWLLVCDGCFYLIYWSNKRMLKNLSCLSCPVCPCPLLSVPLSPQEDEVREGAGGSALEDVLGRHPDE